MNQCCGAQLVDREVGIGRYERLVLVYRICPHAKWWEIGPWNKHDGYILKGQKLREYWEEKKKEEEQKKENERAI